MPGTYADPVPVDPATSLNRRFAGLVIALIAVAPLVVGMMLHPSADGHGTHTQLGMPACGWVAAFDRPCPTCGMTTAFSDAARGWFAAALAAQPMGALLAVVAAAVFWGGLHVGLTGCRLDRLVRAVMAPRTLWIAAGLAAGAWGYKLLTW